MRVDKLSGTLTPWVRLYGPTGALVASVAASPTAQINLTATNSGAFLALVADDSAGYAGSGNLQSDQ